MSIVYFVIIGVVAGWLAGLFAHGKGFGLLGNLIMGVLGALLGGFVFELVGIKSVSLLGQLVTATVGAVLLILLLGFVAKSSRR